MPDNLPPRVPTPSFTPDAYDETRALGRNRRRRQAAWVSGGSGAVAAVVAAVVFAQSASPGGQAILIPGDATPTMSVSASPAEFADVPSPSPSPSSSLPVALPSASIPPRPVVVGSSTPAPTHSAEPSPKPVSEAGVTTGPRPTVTTYDVSRKCDGSGPTPAIGWCSYYDGHTSAAYGGKAELAGAVCRMPGRGTGSLTAGDGEYAVFNAGKSDGGTLWDWSNGRTFSSKAASWDVAEGKCLRFAVIWGLNGNNGRPLAPGKYSVDARPNVVDSNSPRADIVTPVSFTIT